MKKKLLLASASVVTTLGLAGFALYSQGLFNSEASELKASLSAENAGASVDGPVPVIGPSYDLSAHQTLSRVVILIKENYVDPDRIQPYEMFLAALDHVEKSVAEVIVDDSQAPQRIKVSVGSAERIFDLERLGGLDQLWEVTLALRDIFRFVQTEITDPEQRRDIEYAAINGMLSSLDPHSILLKPENFDEVRLSTKGEFGGLGIVIAVRDGQLTIISPIGGTPASRAGLKAKDKVVKIGEESTVNMSLEEAVQRLRGKAGTKVNIWILRKGWTESRRFSMTRAIIKIESVTSQMLASDIGYVRIKSFQANTFDDLHTHLERLRRRTESGLRGLVLDLRNNPGGLLDQAILVSDRFVERGPLVVTVGEGNRKRDVKSAHVSGTENDYPIAVLVNGGSASASEIVAGALKNHDRGMVVGQQTFGKGSVQVLYDFKDRSALKLTIAQYLTPGDVSIQSVGITPDVEIVPATISANAVHLFADDDSPREKDLDHHLDTPGKTSAWRGGRAPEGAEVYAEAGLAEPTARIVHLVSDEDENDDGGAGQDEFSFDFETRLAHDLLNQARSTTRSEILEESSALFAQRTGASEAEIGEKLKALGVDWSDGADAGSPRAALDLEILGNTDGHVTAGEEVTVRATVRNVGDGPLYRVFGVTQSDNLLLKHIEMPFGHIPAGQSRRWDAKVKLPKDLSARADELKVTLDDLYHHTRTTDSLQIVSVTEVKKPRFAYSYRFDDRKGGNGDGVLQHGEQVEMRVDVHNVGEGAGDEVMVAIKNLSSKGIFLKEGRAKIGVLAAGAKKVGTLKFSVREPTDQVKLRLSVWDSQLGELLSEDLLLPVAEPRRAKSDRRVLRVSVKSGARVFSGARDDSPLIGQARPGAALRAEALYDGTWFRAAIGNGMIGFVRSDEVTASKTGNRRPSANAVKLERPQAAPAVTLEMPDLVTQQATLRLKGTLSDERSLQDVYIFVGDKKVYYRSLGSLQPGADGVMAPLDVILPLEPGSNLISVIARENEELATRRIFGVFRTAANAVAERTGVQRNLPQ